MQPEQNSTSATSEAAAAVGKWSLPRRAPMPDEIGRAVGVAGGGATARPCGDGGGGGICGGRRAVRGGGNDVTGGPGWSGDGGDTGRGGGCG